MSILINLDLKSKRDLTVLFNRTYFEQYILKHSLMSSLPKIPRITQVIFRN